jgi:predicted TIM-barrel fold metal-dependent hydrolase
MVCGDTRRLRFNYLPADFQADFSPLPVQKSIAIEGGSTDPLAETQWLQDLGDTEGYPTAIVPYANLADPDIANRLDAFLQYPRVRGIRHIIAWHEDAKVSYVPRADYMTDSQWLKGFSLLAPRGLSFDLQIYPSQLADAARLATRFETTRVILNHAGMPLDRDFAGLAAWREGIALLSACPNVYIKISGLGMTDWKWTPDTISPFIHHILDAFGPERSMFGSNFPVDKLYSSYGTLYSAYDDLTWGLSASQREAVFHETAEKAYRL